jgi:hypothetical protein
MPRIMQGTNDAHQIDSGNAPTRWHPSRPRAQEAQPHLLINADPRHARARKRRSRTS